MSTEKLKDAAPSFPALGKITSNDDDLAAQASALLLENHSLRKLHKSLSTLQTHSSTFSKLSLFDLNDLPYISQMRSLLLIVCASTFIIAPIAYMPLATIQAAYDQKCFLYTRVRLHALPLSNSSLTLDIYAVDAMKTEWGNTMICDFTTFVPVMMSILSVIIGLSTFTIWPTMMSIGRGGALMMTYTFLAIASLVTCSVSLSYLHSGYKDTCDMMKEEQDIISGKWMSCSLLNNNDILIPELRNSRLARNINRSMVLAEIIGWCLVGLMMSQITICILTFLIIWFYINTR